MNTVIDRVVQYANRYQLTDVDTGEVLGTFDFDEVTGTVTTVGTEINKELFDSIAEDIETLTINLNTEISERKTAVSQLQSDIEDGTVVAGKAVKLQTARRITVSLSTAAASGTTFDGSAAVTIGVTGTLPVANGGTGNTTGKATLATTTADTSSAIYPVGVTSSATTKLLRDTSITMSGDTITATTFSGSLSGNATSADKVNSTLSITLNGITTTTYNGSSAQALSFYTPTTAGTADYVLKSNGTGSAPTWVQLSSLETDIPTATTDTLGGVKLGSDTVQTVTANSVSSTSSRTYAVQVNSSGQLMVNVPWSDTNTDTNMTQTVTSVSSSYDYAYPVLFKYSSSTSTTTSTGRFAAAFTYNPYTDTLTASTFSGDLTGNADTATTLATARTIDGVSFNGSTAIIHYGTCSTAAGTTAKTVAVTGFTLVTGAIVYVKFSYTNTASSPTLNVNSTGAKSIYYRGEAITAGYLASGRTYAFVYNGTQYEVIGDIDTDTDTDTDTKVTNTLGTTTKFYVTGTSNASTNTGTQYFDTGVYVSTTAGELVATTFTGKMSTTNTATLNGTAYAYNGSAAKSYSWYAPTTAGTSGQVLVSSGSGAPTWSDTVDLATNVTNVYQSVISTSASYPVLFSGTSGTSPTAGYKTVATDGGLYYNPSTNNLTATTFTGKMSTTNTATLNGTAYAYNGSAAKSYSWYAPTTAGTSGQVLVSSGSGAPTWSDGSSIDRISIGDGTASKTGYIEFAEYAFVHAWDDVKIHMEFIDRNATNQRLQTNGVQLTIRRAGAGVNVNCILESLYGVTNDYADKIYVLFDESDGTYGTAYVYFYDDSSTQYWYEPDIHIISVSTRAGGTFTPIKTNTYLTSLPTTDYSAVHPTVSIQNYASKVSNALTLSLNGSSSTYDGSATVSKSWYAPTAGGATGTILIGAGTTTAPTWLAAGTSGYVLCAKGSGTTPAWTAQSSLSVGTATTATKLSTSAGAESIPVYFSSGVPVACSYITVGSSYISLGNTSNTASYEHSVSIGESTLASASYATALGYGAQSTYSYSVAIGYNAKAQYTGSLAIGTATAGPASAGSTRINCGSYTSTGQGVLIGVAGTAYTYINAAGSSWTSASDIRDKTDIEEIDHALDFINKVTPITYVMNDRKQYLNRDDNGNPILDENGKQTYDEEAHAAGTKKKHRRFAGVSAQETYQALLDCYDNNDNYAAIVDNSKYDNPDDEYIEQLSVQYERFVPFLIKAVQELSAKVDELEEKLKNS